MRTDALIKKLRSYDKHNHRGQYAVLLHEAADRIESMQSEIRGLKMNQVGPVDVEKEFLASDAPR